MYWKKANQTGALAGFIGGWSSWLVFLWMLYPTTLEVNGGDVELAIWDATYISSVPAFFISLILVVVVSLATQKSDQPRQLTDVDGKYMPMRGRLGILPLRDALRKLRPEELAEGYVEGETSPAAAD
jgi:Na+/proline symporter